jgi:predicted nucleic acid-binding protein
MKNLTEMKFIMKVLLDTNLWIYAFIDNGSDKNSKIINLLTKEKSASEIIISIQIINEIHWVLKRKYKFSEEDIFVRINDISKITKIVPIDFLTYKIGYELRIKHSLSFWDSLIIASAKQSNVNVIYSEDMQDNFIIDQNIKILNPLKN